MADISDIKVKRGVIKTQLTRFSTFFQRINQNEINLAVIKELSARLNKIQECYEKFDSLQNELEVRIPEELTSNSRLEFEDTFFSVTSQAEMIIESFYKNNEHENENQNENSSVRSSNSISGDVNVTNSNFVKLPTIRLPTFNGDYGNWLEFRDLFNALVDENASLSPIQKFYHLKTCLSDEPKKIIAKLDTTASNYNIAWESLKERYENKGLMIHNHIKGIFEMPSLNRESHVELRDLYNSINEHLMSLKSLGENVDTWDRLIIFILTQKFDNATRRGWESYKFLDSDKCLPTMEHMHDFLRERCQMLEKLANDKPDKKGIVMNKFKRSSSSSSFVTTSETKCYFCKKGHTIYKCADFLKLSINKRIAEVRKRGLCNNCFNPSHSTNECKFRKCFKCFKSHNTLLHIDNRPGHPNSEPGEDNKRERSQELGTNEANIVERVSQNPENVSSSSYAVEADSHTRPVAGQILLSTAIINIKIRDEYYKARILLDNASQCNFISKQFCNKIKAEKILIDHIINGVGVNVFNISHKVRLQLKSLCTNFEYCDDFLVIDQITKKLPKYTFSKHRMEIPSHFTLADPNFNVSGDIDLLLNADFFWKIIIPGHLKIGVHLPTLQNTQLGWIVSGRIGVGENPSLSLHIMLDDENPNFENINEQISKFWILEESCKPVTYITKDEQYCEEYFKQTVKKDNTGRFIVKIPFKKSVSELGLSQEIALKRFYSLENRLLGRAELREQYVKFMEEYKELGHMTKVELRDNSLDSSGYFIPHHAVLKQSSLTTQCRVVFNASCPTNNGLSLNSVQFPGPALQNDIIDILLRFRKYKFVIAGDISKMYRQILIDRAQRRYQRIFWRPSNDKELECFELNTVTYGTASAPYLAIRCLLQLSKENAENFPIASKIIARDFYIDDLLTGADSEDEVLQIQKDVSGILASAGFQLRKWISNDSTLLKKFTMNKNLEVNVLPIGEDINNKTLGVYWNAALDFIQYSVPVNQYNSSQITKRNILSVICQIYDPLGLIGPIIVVGKLLIQTLWQIKISWDSEVPSNVAFQWKRFYNNLYDIKNLKIPRQCLLSDYILIELHGFADASEKAYAAVCYIRVLCPTKGYFSHLVCSKSRLAPLKQVSLPRLELCGALLLANLMNRVNVALEINFTSKYFWTDSMIVLAWVKAEPSRWKTFVANRVSEIQNLSDVAEWFHVASEENPADLLSRGTEVNNLIISDIWWYGPKWLQKENDLWKIEPKIVNDLVPENKNISITCIATNHSEIISDLINRISSFSKLLRVTTWVLRFLHNVKRSNAKRGGILTPRELDAAERLLVMTAQIQSFPSEYLCLKKSKLLNNKSKLLSLCPFLDNDVLRVGGRLENAKVGYERKHQLILPKHHLLTTLIVRHEHEKLLHCGVQMLMSSLRNKFWPLSCRNTCKAIIRSCNKCFRVKPKENLYVMGNLPKCRVNEYLPFINVGVDYGGPFFIKDRKGRGAKVIKAYLCLFVCMSSKAVHLELVCSLTRNDFLNAFKRFISRRGRPSNIYSDNGSNFLGACRYLQELYQFLSEHGKDIAEALVSERINWHFIPSRAPNFGGLWEAGIKSVKFHLKRVVGESLLTYEDFYTVLTQIESILNSRPLCPLSSDPEDLNPLTPAHLLINRSLIALPEEDVGVIPENRLDQFQKLQRFCQHFWKRWHKEYINELQTRVKWAQNSRQLIKVGDLVLIKNENSPPLCWKLGRILQLFPGQDGVCRVADVRIQNGGTLRRAITKLCLLPTQ